MTTADRSERERPQSGPRGGGAVLLPTGRGPDWRAGVIDLLIPALISVLAAHDLLNNGAGPGAWALAFVTVWPLVLRRRAPVMVFALCLAGVSAITLTLSPPFAGFSMLPALYTVAAHRTIRWSVPALLALETVVLLVAPQAAPARSVDDTVVVLSAFALAALLLGTTVRSQRHYLVALEDRAERLEQEQQQRAQMAATAERTRIAREMHDIVAHGLAVMTTLAEGAATRAIQDPTTAKTTMEQVSSTGRQSLGEMRRLLSVLRPDGDERDPDSARQPQPLLAELPALVADVRRTGLQIELDADPRLSELEPTLQATLYRTAQEALTNVMKHGRSVSRVVVRLRQDADGIVFAVSDDGRRSPAGTAADGNGLRGMAERVAMFGGEVTAGFEPGGWVVRGRVHEEEVGRGLRARRR